MDHEQETGSTFFSYSHSVTELSSMLRSRHCSSTDTRCRYVNAEYESFCEWSLQCDSVDAMMGCTGLLSGIIPEVMARAGQFRSLERPSALCEDYRR